MSLRSKIGLGMVVAGILIGAASFWLNTARLERNHRESIRLAAADETTREIRRAEQRVMAAEQKRVQAEDALNQLAEAASSQTKPAVRPVTSQSERLDDQPAQQVLELKRLRAAYQEEYGDFFRQSAFSPEQITRFLDLYVGFDERMMDLRAIARTRDKSGQEALEKLMQTTREDFEAKRASLLGVEMDRQFQVYSRVTVPLENVLVRGLAGAAALEGVPLTAAQGDRLLEAAFVSMPTGAAGNVTTGLKAMDWPAFEERAREILSPAQFRIFSTQAPMSGFQSRTSYELESAIARGLQADAKSGSTPAGPAP